MSEEDKDRSVQSYVALAIGFICIFIGVPLWWKTTEVYRVQLPYSEISDLSEIRLVYTTEVEVISFDDYNKDQILHISQSLQDALAKNSGTEIKAAYRVRVRENSKEELDIISKHKSLTTNPTVLDEELSKLKLIGRERNKYFIFLIPKVFKLPADVYIGRYQNVLVSPVDDVQALINRLVHAVKHYVVREDSVEKSIVNAKGARTLELDKESMRAVRYHPGYDLTFTLTVPQPDILDVSWQIEEAVKHFIDPLAGRFKDLMSLKVTSQYQYLTTFKSKPQKDPKSNEYFYLEQDLPQLINPIESTLGTSSSSNPELNFIVYIPTKDQSPLYVRDKNGRNVPSNSFLSPQWGGFLIYNVPENNSSAPLPLPVTVNMQRVMEVFVSQLRLLLNVNSERFSSNDQVFFESVDTDAVSDIELDAWMRNRCAENLATSINTVRSLAQLLGQISNIVIKDDIGEHIEMAVEAVKNSQRLLLAGDLQAAFLASKAAIIASEKAFFDPSLLELLYFPEDQKFAIYVPLFLPISIPVIGSVYKALKFLRESKKSKED